MLTVEQDRAEALSILAQPLFPPCVALAVTDPTDPVSGLGPMEQIQIAKAVEKRQREFAAGRRAARETMRALGHENTEITIGKQRAPNWPPEVVGSISHSDSICIAASAPASDMLSIGIDVADDRPLPIDLEALICTKGERDWLARHPKHHRRRLAMLVFSAKEACFKCQFPLSQRMLGFDAIEIRLCEDVGAFTAHFLVDADPFPIGTVLQGRFVTGHGMILTAVSLIR